MRPCTVITVSILAAMLLAGCSPEAAISSTSESPPSTIVTQAADDTHMIVCAETEQAIRETALESSIPAISQEADEPEPSEVTAPENPAKETQTPLPDEPSKETQEKPTQPPTEPKPTSPTNPTELPETSPPTERPSEKPSDPPPETQHVHSWGGWTQTKAPICGASGEEARSCFSCGATEKKPVAATGKHSWAEIAPSCTEDGERTCTVCGAKETVSALGHSWVHHEEEGRWEIVIVCYCGAQFQTTEEWDAHASANPDLEYLDAHAGYYAYEEWAVSSPAYESCSRCGEVKTP